MTPSTQTVIMLPLNVDRTALPADWQRPATWRNAVLLTRRYGCCYIPAAVRKAMLSMQVVDFGGITYRWGNYGKSKTKFKAYAYATATGEIVKTKQL